MTAFEAWSEMRRAAIVRHRFINTHFEGGSAVTWALWHMPIIRGFYGW
jgi:hypothetical protein